MRDHLDPKKDLLYNNAEKPNVLHGSWAYPKLACQIQQQYFQYNNERNGRLTALKPYNDGINMNNTTHIAGECQIVCLIQAVVSMAPSMASIIGEKTYRVKYIRKRTEFSYRKNKYSNKNVISGFIRHISCKTIAIIMDVFVIPPHTSSEFIFILNIFTTKLQAP